MEKSFIKNKRASFEYEILERFTAGIVLKGHEVKSIKTGGGNFAGAYLTIRSGELFLEHFHVALYKKATLTNYEPEKTRKLLVRKAEIVKISSALNTQGVTVIPLDCGLIKGKIKIEFALARGKKQWNKREDLRKKDAERRIKFALKDY